MHPILFILQKHEKVTRRNAKPDSINHGEFDAGSVKVQ